jgi:hypothetical protein
MWIECLSQISIVYTYGKNTTSQISTLCVLNGQAADSGHSNKYASRKKYTSRKTLRISHIDHEGTDFQSDETYISK